MHLFYFSTTLTDWKKAALTDEELKMLLEAGRPTMYRDLLDLLV